MDFMLHALDLAKQGQSTCAPNPMVGCIIVKNNNLVGQGFHQVTGGPHAEIFALAQAKENANGSDVYVTLEPCSHFGRTGPCADELIKAKVKRVFVALLDPNIRVRGQGIEKLKKAGIEVQIGAHQERAYELNADFFHAMTHRSPFVIAKWAMSMDGKIATAQGLSKYITSEKALTHAHALRSRVCGIIIGANTLRRDNPLLTVRHGFSQTLLSRQPRPVIISPSGRISLDSTIFHPERKAVIITSDQADPSFLKYLSHQKIEHYVFELVRENLPMKEVFQALHTYCSFRSVLVEGGSRLLTSLYEENLINQIYAYIAPKIMGGKESLMPIMGKNISDMSLVKNLHSQEALFLDPDICLMAKTALSPKNYEEFLNRWETSLNV